MKKVARIGSWRNCLLLALKTAEAGAITSFIAADTGADWELSFPQDDGMRLLLELPVLPFMLEQGLGVCNHLLRMGSRCWLGSSC